MPGEGEKAFWRWRDRKVKNYINVIFWFPFWDSKRVSLFKKLNLISSIRPKGFKNIVRKHEMYDFFQLIPEWEKVSRGLDGVVLGGKSKSLLGQYGNYVITLFSWETEIIWPTTNEEFVKEHEEVFDMFGIPYFPNKNKDGCYVVEFNEQTAKIVG